MNKQLKSVENFFKVYSDDERDFKKDKEGYAFYSKFFSKDKHTAQEISNVFGHLVDLGISSIVKKGKLVFYNVRGGVFGKHEKAFFASITVHFENCDEMEKVIALHQKWDAVEAA